MSRLIEEIPAYIAEDWIVVHRGKLLLWRQSLEVKDRIPFTGRRLDHQPLPVTVGAGAATPLPPCSQSAGAEPVVLPVSQPPPTSASPFGALFSSSMYPGSPF